MKIITKKLKTLKVKGNIFYTSHIEINENFKLLSHRQTQTHTHTKHLNVHKSTNVCTVPLLAHIKFPHKNCCKLSQWKSMVETYSGLSGFLLCLLFIFPTTSLWLLSSFFCLSWCVCMNIINSPTSHIFTDYLARFARGLSKVTQQIWWLWESSP